jgi:hypothetical protein
MATITSLLLPATGNSNRGRMPYQVELTVDLTAQAIDCSSTDIVQCITIPANTHIVHAGVQVVESATMDTGTNAAITLGAADVDEYVTSFDIDGASALAYAPSVTPSAEVVLATADTLDLVFAGDGATFTAGKLRVYALLMDVSEQGSTSAAEVARDSI